MVQGPVKAITAQCLQSVRQHFPKARLILSTWKNQQLPHLPVDEILELNDPGPNNIVINGQTRQLNNNRQLFSTHQGLLRVQTPYAVKLRSDNLICGRDFVELYQQYHDAPRIDRYRYLQQRVMTRSAIFVDRHHGAPVHFCKSDLFDFGLTADLLTLWPASLLETLHFSPGHGYKVRPPAAEQFLCLRWLSTLLNTPLQINQCAFDDAGLGVEFWQHFVANNLIVAEPKRLGLDVTTHFYHRGNIIFEWGLNDWLAMAGLQTQSISCKSVLRSVRNHWGLTKRFIFSRHTTKNHL